MIPPPIAAKSPSLILATRHTGPPSREAMMTAPITGRGSIPFSSSLDLPFFSFSCTGTEYCLLDLTLAPILVLASLDRANSSGERLECLLVWKGGDDDGGGGESKLGDLGQTDDLLSP